MRFYLHIILAGLLCTTAYADRGDVFMSVKGMAGLLYEEFSGGGEIGLEFGFNDKTDFQLSTNILYGPESSGNKSFFVNKTSFTSFFTPYFGDIMPRIGGSFGLVYLNNDNENANELMPMIGVPIQALASLSSSFSLVGEAAPTLAFGSASFFDVALKLGVRFRISR